MVTPSVLEHIPNLPSRCTFSDAKVCAAGSQSQLAETLKPLTIQPWPSIPLEPTPGHITLYDGYALVPISVVTTLRRFAKARQQL